MTTTFTSYSHLEGTTTLALEIDKDVLNVLNFMSKNIEASKLVTVSEQVVEIAPLLWGTTVTKKCPHYEYILNLSTLCSNN